MRNLYDIGTIKLKMRYIVMFLVEYISNAYKRHVSFKMKSFSLKEDVCSTGGAHATIKCKRSYFQCLFLFLVQSFFLSLAI